jgi:hypothetical protein
LDDRAISEALTAAKRLSDDEDPPRRRSDDVERRGPAEP